MNLAILRRAGFRAALSAATLVLAASAANAQAPAVTTSGVRSLYTNLAGVAQIVQDSHGNIIYCDQLNDSADNAVFILTPGATTPTALVTGLVGTQGLALDSAGNLYVAAPYSSPSGILEKIPYQNGAYDVAAAVDLATPLSTASVGGGYIEPLGVAVDSTGYVYVSELKCGNTDPSVCYGGNGAYAIFKIKSDGTNPSVFYGPLPGGEPALDLALDQYGNLSWGDHNGLWSLNVNDATPTAIELTTASTNGASVNAAGDLIVSEGQGAPYDTVIIPNENGRPNPAHQYIAAGNTYDQYGPGFNRVSGEIFSGDGYYAGDGTIRGAWLEGASLGASPVGTPLYGAKGSFNFNAATTAGAINVFNFNNFSYGGSNCAAQAYAADTYCTLYVNFTPTQVGPLNGAIYMNDASSNRLATLYTTGIGEGALVSTLGGAVSTLISSSATIGSASLASPYGVAVDISNNVYVADTANKRILKLASGTTAATVLPVTGTPFNSPRAVAVDAAYNVYVADGNGAQVLKIDGSGNVTTLISSTTQVSGTTIGDVEGIAVDGLGNVFVSDTSHNRIVRIPAVGTPVTLVASSVQFGASALSAPRGIAVDGNDNLFIADTGNNRIVEFTNLQAASVAPSNGKTFSAPTGVAVDPAGDLYVTDASGVTAIYQNGHEAAAIASGLSSADGIAIDVTGNLYVANTGDNSVVELNTSAPTVNLGSVQTGHTSAAASLLVYNIGNQPLTFSAAPALDHNDTQFALTSDTCTNGTTVAPGGVCLLGVTFTPAASGAVSGTITLTDNAPGGTQTITLAGMGTAPAKTNTSVALTASPNPVTVGGTVTLTAQVSPTGGTAPTGSVTFSVGTTTLATVAVQANGRAVLSAPTTGYGAGTYPVVASYSGDANFNPSSSASVSVVLAPIPGTTTAVVANPNPAQEGASVTITTTVTASSGTAKPTGSVTYSYGTTTLTTTNLNSNGVASFTASTQGLAPGSYIITVKYAGNSSFGASTGSVNVGVIKATTQTALTATPTTVTAGQSVTLRATVSRGGSSAAATGTITFKVGTTTIGTAILNNGVATLTQATTGVAAGTYPVVASYAGDVNNNPSTSNSVNVTIQ